MQEAFRYLEPY